MKRGEISAGNAPGWLVWVALWVVYIVWGSTYLAIRVTVETMPPLLTAGVRFLIAGLLVYGFLLVRRGWTRARVTVPELLGSAFVGTALLLGGNGAVSIAELKVPSSLAALLIASVPLWVVLLRMVTGEKVPRATLVGVAVGFVGVGILLLPGGQPSGASIGSMLLVVAAAFSWATGSFFSKKLPLPRDPFLSTAVQMLTGGAVMFVAGIARGELRGIDPSQFSGASIAGFLYLIVAGSLVAFTAYVWLLQNAPISKVATYAYVNPIVAIFLGWLILSEEMTLSVILGASVIVASVAAIVKRESQPATAPVESPPVEVTAGGVPEPHPPVRAAAAAEAD